MDQLRGACAANPLLEEGGRREPLACGLVWGRMRRGCRPPHPWSSRSCSSALGPAWAGSGPSGGLARRGCKRELTPAAEQSRSPPLGVRGGVRRQGPGEARQKGLPGIAAPLTRLSRQQAVQQATKMRPIVLDLRIEAC
jgi:hypothetical protein